MGVGVGVLVGGGNGLRDGSSQLGVVWERGVVGNERAFLWGYKLFIL